MSSVYQKFQSLPLIFENRPETQIIMNNIEMFFDGMSLSKRNVDCKVETLYDIYLTAHITAPEELVDEKIKIMIRGSHETSFQDYKQRPIIGVGGCSPNGIECNMLLDSLSIDKVINYLGYKADGYVFEKEKTIEMDIINATLNEGEALIRFDVDMFYL